jgi:hypothetical protein
MKKSADSTYEAPRAVRLSDARTGTFSCLNGPTGTADQCTSGFAVVPHNVCITGALVQEI